MLIRSAAIVFCSAVLLATAGCTKGASNPRPGEVIKPYITTPAFNLSPPKVPTLSLEEYFDRRKYLVTGKSISFAIPTAYLTNPANWNGGAQNNIGLTYDTKDNTFAPIPQWGQGEDLTRVEVNVYPYRLHNDA